MSEESSEVKGAERPFKDNRLQLRVDPDQIEIWELMLFEDQTVKITDLAMVFSRYLSNGNGPVSPGLPAGPIDELSDEQRAEIKAGAAFKALKRFSREALIQAARSFAEQATAGLDPN